MFRRWTPALVAFAYLVAMYACAMAMCWGIFKVTGAM